MSDYDLAILHFDENVLHPENCGGYIEPRWGNAFKWFSNNVNLPKIAICHGTPQFYGQYSSAFVEQKDIKIIESSRKELVEFTRDMLVITNSHQANHEWEFNTSKTIWQGFDPIEYPKATYKKGILSLGKPMKERPHYRGYFTYQDTQKHLLKDVTMDSLVVPDPVGYSPQTNPFAYLKYRNYVDAIRQYSIYFNPTLRSPMPRSRGEAMMCGLVTVSADNHDVNMFIDNGVNGFYSNNPQELADYLTYLLKNPDKLRSIGQRSRDTACDVFNHDNYLEQWFQTIKGILK